MELQVADLRQLRRRFSFTMVTNGINAMADFGLLQSFSLSLYILCLVSYDSCLLMAESFVEEYMTFSVNIKQKKVATWQYL